MISLPWILFGAVSVAFFVQGYYLEQQKRKTLMWATIVDALLKYAGEKLDELNELKTKYQVEETDLKPIATLYDDIKGAVDAAGETFRPES